MSTAARDAGSGVSRTEAGLAGPENDTDFYIGYEPSMPARLAGFIRRVVPGICAASLLATATIAAGHRLIEAGIFEFGRTRTLSGTIVESPYPAIRPGGGRPDVLLVARGKLGAAEAVRGLDGRLVHLAGTRIARNGQEMLEVASVEARGERDGRRTGLVDEGARPTMPTVTLRGEIVDSKCFLGVMAPGNGRTHRACASLCLRGGIPPALYVQDREGRSRLLLLTAADGAAIDPQLASAWAGEPIEVTGVTGRRAGWQVLASDPASWRRLR